MLVKCETKSNRVKGLSFHPKLSWILASLHNGTIQLWDYRIGSLIDKFEEHEGGPVRGVCFHSSQPLFVSGGDDYKIKVWNYKMRRCIFTLLGHLDYIRTVEFHDEYPWILSASDDQTIRIWNWQSRSCIAVLTGHNHYVMCSHFHPKEDLVVSASLDQTVRVWDTSGLRDKTVMGGGSSGGGSGGGGAPQGAGDVFGTSDAVVKYVLEGHDRGVNWAAFHPTLPLIVSGADDRLIKLWRMNDSKAWEVDTLRGHFNNVSCVMFHPKKELILSNSEDRTIRVWDTTKRTGIHTFRRENDRFWFITCHRTSNLIAVGHDAGMVVFKLDCERPLAMCNNNHLYVVQDRNVQDVDLDKANLTGHQVASCRRPPNAMTSGMKSLMHNTYNPSETNVLVFYSQDNGCYDLFVGPSDVSSSGDSYLSPKQGNAQAVCFTARNRFAVLQHSGSIGIYNLQNELSKKIDVPGVTADYIYPGGNNRILLKSEEKVYMYDLTARKTVDEVAVPGGVRYVVWSQNGNYVAFMSKHNVLMCGKNLEYHHSFHENIRVKSGAWDENGVFVYSTLSHVKYCLTNGDSGIIHSLQNPIYIVRVHKQNLWFIDRENQVHRQKLNCTEYLFKLSLHQRKFNDVKMWIQNGRLCGNVVIGYLKQKGFPEVALHFVEDQQTRFNLALEYGHIEVAMTAAQELDEQTCWNRLGLEALRQGNQQIVEMVYQKTMNLDSLSFLYLITGSATKLKKMSTIAVKRQDVMLRFNNALMLGNIEERVKILAEMGQVPLATLTAKTHNITEFIERLEDQMQGTDVSSQIPPNAQLLLPPVPLFKAEQGDMNWPLLKSTQMIFKEKAFEEQQASQLPEERTFDQMEDDNPEITHADWEEAGDVNLGGGAWGDDGLDGLDGLEGFEDIPADEPVAEQKSSVVTVGDSAQQKWLKKRKLAADLIAAGEFEDALNLLKKRLGVINVDPLEPLFKQAYWATCMSIPGLPQSPSLNWPLLASGSLKGRDPSPMLLFTVQYVIDQVKEAYQKVSQGAFKESLTIFRSSLQCIPLSFANDAKDEQSLTEMIDVCREYTNAMRLELARKSLDPTQVARNIELAAYFTCCKLNGSHSFLALQTAMATAFKGQNFVTAASFAKRLVQGNFNNLNKPAEMVAKAKKLLQVCEAKASDAHEIAFDTKAPVEDFKMCAGSFTRIDATAPTVSCPYCGAVYNASYKGKLCDTCELAEIGANTLGIQLRPI
jgi:coatomer protein complex subunit alpha (xenin)